MPSSVLIKQICTVGGDCDINSPPLDLSMIGIDMTFIHWYHDVNYGSDEYGCRSTPNIFHVWLIDRQGNHINVLGQECTPYWGWCDVKSLHYDNGKWYILWSGLRYTGPSRGYPFIAVIDISDPNNPSANIIEGSSEISTPCQIIANILNGKIVYTQSRLSTYIFDFNDLLSATTLDDVLSNAIKIDVGVGHVAGLMADKIIIVDGNGNWYIYDYDGTQINTGTYESGLRPPIPIYYQGEVAVWVWRFNCSTASIIKEDGSVITKSVPSYSGDAWKHGVYGIGVKLFYAVEPAGKAILYDAINDVLVTDIDVDCPIISTGRSDNLVCVDKIMGYGNYKRFIPDSYFKVIINGKKVTVTDSNGNPLSGKTVYMWKVSALTNMYVGIDNNYVVDTTDENGQVSIPLDGVVAVAVP